MEVLNSYGNRVIPHEVVDNICQYLEKDTRSLKNTRRICRAFNSVVTPLLPSLWHTPAELFVLPNGQTDYTIKRSWTPELDKIWLYWSAKPLTIWTWLEIPPNVPLENKRSRVGREFSALFVGQHTPANPDRLCFRWRGRKAACWGRVKEKPHIFCIVMQWRSEDAWTAFRGSEYAQEILLFFQAVAPGCITTSKSERTPLPRSGSGLRPLFKGYSEIRTVYFESNISEAQRAVLEKERYPLWEVWDPPEEEDPVPHSGWTWLYGVRELNGRSVVAARFIFDWGGPKAEREYETTFEGRTIRKVVGISEDDLRAAGMIDSESIHCAFIAGNWVN